MSGSQFIRCFASCAGVMGVAVVALSGCGGGSASNTSTSTSSTGTTSTSTSATGTTSTSTAASSSSYVTSGTTPFTNTNIASRGVCTANAHQSGRATWTVLVYLNAASNLQPDSLLNIAQMASVGSDANLNIVVQWKQTTTAAKYFGSVTPETTPSFVGTRRYKISKHSQADINRIAPAGIDTNSQLVGDTTVLDGDRLADPPTNTLTDQGNATSDMGSYQTLADFIKWGTTNYPADHICLVIWDHGSAALNVDNRSAARAKRSATTRRVMNGRVAATLGKPTRGLSQDTQTGSQIATQELPLALANTAQALDMVVVDCSLEGTVEVAYDLRNSARVFVGTEESPPGAGYPYDAWLGYLQANPSVGPCDSGSNLITDTIARYPNEANITESMADLTKMDAVASAVNAFGGSLKNYATAQATLIGAARRSSQYFDFIEYKDLYDFANQIRASSGVPSDLASAAGNVLSSLLGSSGAILMSAHGLAQSQEAYANGLSIFLPGPQTPSSVDATTGYDPQYANLGFAKAAPNWATFLQSQQQ